MAYVSDTKDLKDSDLKDSKNFKIIEPIIKDSIPKNFPVQFLPEQDDPSQYQLNKDVYREGKYLYSYSWDIRNIYSSYDPRFSSQLDPTQKRYNSLKICYESIYVGTKIMLNGFPLHIEVATEKDGSIQILNQLKEYIFRQKPNKLFERKFREREIDRKLVEFPGDKNKDLKTYQIISERRLVLFVNNDPDIPELTLFMGYITDNSKYIAPYMIDTGNGYWINVGSIYGTIDINDLMDNFYLSFERSYDTGKLVNELIRTSFIPLYEAPSANEYRFVNPNSRELWYIRYYSQDESGKLVSQEDFNKYKAAKAGMLKDISSSLIWVNEILDFD